MTDRNHEQAPEMVMEGAPGPRLRRLREQAGLSQRELARRAGVTNATISQVEQGRVSPSVASLHKIVDALGLSLAVFFSDAPDADLVPFQMADSLTELGSGGVSLRLVGSAFPGRELQMLIESYPPGTDTGEEMLQHQGQECGVVIEGKIEVTVGGRTRELGPGDSFMFSSRTPHRFRNTGDVVCKLVSAATPPTL